MTEAKDSKNPSKEIKDTLLKVLKFIAIGFLGLVLINSATKGIGE